MPKYTHYYLNQTTQIPSLGMPVFFGDMNLT